MTLITRQNGLEYHVDDFFKILTIVYVQIKHISRIFSNIINVLHVYLTLQRGIHRYHKPEGESKGDFGSFQGINGVTKGGSVSEN